MPTIALPYHRGFLEASVPEGNLRAVLTGRLAEKEPPGPAAEIIDEALDNPLGAPRLEELARGREVVTIITSDHTRPLPSRLTLPHLLERIRAASPRAKIRILVATGFHRPSTPEELAEKFGAELVGREEILVHDAFDPETVAYLGKLPSGGDLYVNKIALECDLLVAEGFIEPHFFAGFSGGCKSVLPGVAGEVSIRANHCAASIAHPKARAGVLEGNPVYEDMVHAGRKAGLAFVLNVVLNGKKEIVAAFAGDPVVAHREGCAFVGELARVERCPADIVVTTNGGYPLDQNIYQAVKGMTAAEATCREGGVIIMVAACADGHGGEGFYRTFAEAADARLVYSEILKRKWWETTPDQWEAQILARIMAKHTVFLVTDMCDPEVVKRMHLRHAATFAEALEGAFALKGREADVVVIPDGVSVIVA